MKFLMSSTFYPPYHLGGDATHVKYLAEELTKVGHEVHVFYNKDAYMVKRRNLPQITESQGVFTHEFESRLNLSPYFAYLFGNSPAIIRKFNLLVKEIRPDIVHHHNISLLGYRLLNNSGSYACIYTAHDYWLVCPTNNLFKNQEEICVVKNCFSCSLRSKRIPQVWRSYRNFKMAIRNIDLLISPSEYVRKRLVQEIDVPSITLPNFAPYPPDNIPSSGYENYFLFLGVLEKHKGILNLLELFKEQRHNLNAKLVIAGGGSLSPYIREYIEKNSLSNSISFLGFVDNPTKYSLYANALAIIIPSIWPENAPLVALEALSVGAPVITSSQGGLPEITEKVDKKLIFDNVSGLRDVLLSFSRSEFPSSKVKKVYEQNFSPKAYIGKYTEAIAQLRVVNQGSQVS